MNAPPPRIAIGPAKARSAGSGGDVPGIVLLFAEWLRIVPHAAARAVIAGLIEEGRNFAGTPSGRRWRSVLIESDWAMKGWLLWNLLEMDGVISDDPARPDSAAAAIENLAALFRAANAADPVAEQASSPDPSPLFGRRAGLGPATLYDERNPFLDFALGAVAVAERTVTALAEAGDPLAPAAPRVTHGEPPYGPILR